MIYTHDLGKIIVEYFLYFFFQDILGPEATTQSAQKLQKQAKLSNVASKGVLLLPDGQKKAVSLWNSTIKCMTALDTDEYHMQKKSGVVKSHPESNYICFLTTAFCLPKFIQSVKPSSNGCSKHSGYKHRSLRNSQPGSIHLALQSEQS